MKRIPAAEVIEIFVLLVLPMLSSRISLLYILIVMTVILLVRHRRKEKWSDYGFKAVNIKSVLLAAVTGIVLAVFSNYIQEPMVSRLTGETADLSGFDSVQGNLWAYMGLLSLGWIIGGLFEEFLFRGYLLRRINMVAGNPAIGKWIGILLTSISFAIAHLYQGAGGMINTFIFSVVLGILFYLFKRNTWYVIIIHGFFDTFGITWIYLGG